MPASIEPRSGISAEALYDKNSRRLWIEYPAGNAVQLGSAADARSALAQLRELGLAPTGDWTVSYASVRSCLVRVPHDWTSPPLR